MKPFIGHSPSTPVGHERRRIGRGISGQRIRIHTLGRFGIQIDGRALPARALRQQKPMELLQCVIALGGRSVHKDSLSASLWPDADGDDAANSYSVTLHRLRRLLEYDNALIAHGGGLTINNEVVWVDAWTFERILNQIDRSMRAPGGRDAETPLDRLLHEAMPLYQGGFLPHGAHKPWGLSFHERLRSRLMHCIVHVGGQAEGDGQWLAAADCYQRGIELDPLYELFYQRLMICYRDADRTSEARSVYLRCRANLLAGLAAAPSPETERILGTL